MRIKEEPRKVLIIRFTALADVAITIPVVYSVCAAYPHIKFYMVTRQWSSYLFIERPRNLVVLGVDVRNKYKGVKGMLKLAKKLRKDYKIDAVADLHSVIRSWVIDSFMKSHGVRLARIDKGHKMKKLLTKGKIKRQLTTTHDRYVEVFNKIGLAFKETFEGYQKVETQIIPPKPDNETWVAVAPFSQHRSKEYPLEKMEEVIKLLLNHDPNLRIILFGGGSKEKALLHKVTMKYERTFSVAEAKHGFTDEFAVLRQCNVMVSMDSANMHLASLTRTPVVSVWGGTHRYSGFLGWKQNPNNIVELDYECRPCSVFGQAQCRYGDYHCLTDIKPETIFNQVLKVLEKQKKHD